MSGAIVAKALNSSIGTSQFKGFDEIIKAELGKNNEILERVLTDYANKSLCKGYAIAEEPLFYLLKDHSAELRFASNSEFELGNSIVFNCNGFIAVKCPNRNSYGSIRIKLNNEVVDTVYLEQTGEFGIELQIHKGDRLSLFGVPSYYASEDNYRFAASRLTMSINAKEVNLAGLEVVG